MHRIIPLLALAGWITGTCSAETITVEPGADVIQAALAAAKDGDILLLTPGTYTNTRPIDINKRVTVASAYLASGNDEDRDGVVIQGPPGAEEWLVLSAPPTAAGRARLIGVWVQGNGLHTANITSAWAEILHCKFTGGKDQVSLTWGGGRVAYCHIEGSGDDNIDCDNTQSWMIDHNTLVNAHEDGIEVRLHPDKAQPRTHVFCYNLVSGSGQSGIQLINYAGDSRREFFIHHNLFRNCRGAGVSCMHDEQSQEDYRGSPMEEKATIYNNTFDGGNAGITLAPRLVILNNIFSHLTKCALVRGNFVTAGATQPVIDHCLFFDNAAHYDAGPIPGAHHLIDKDPLYVDRVNYALPASSPGVDAGTAIYARAEEQVFSMAAAEYSGAAPDLGANEHGSSGPVTSRRLPQEVTLGPFVVRP